MAELRVMTYNVRSLRDDADAVAAVIRACEPDVVCVQEAPRKLRWRSKRAALARKAGLVVATADGPGGLMVMTSLAAKVLSTRFTLLPKSPELHQRAVAMAEVELRGSRWAIASVHLGVDADERGRHLELLYAFVDTSDAPLVVAGDFNNEPDGPIWRSLASRMQDAYAVVPDGPGESYPARAPRRRIDGVFAAPGIEVVSCRTVHDLPDLVAASDHLPVLAVLRQ